MNMGGGHHGGGSTIIYGGLGWPVWPYYPYSPTPQATDIKSSQKALENIILQIPTVWSVASINNALVVGVKDAQTKTQVERNLNNGIWQGFPVKIIIEKQSEAQSNFVEEKTKFIGGNASLASIIIPAGGAALAVWAAHKYLHYTDSMKLILSAIGGAATLSLIFSLGQAGIQTISINSSLDSQL